MKTFITIKNNTEIFKAKYVIKDDRIWIYVYKNAENMPMFFSDFNKNTTALIIQSWVVENVGKLQ